MKYIPLFEEFMALNEGSIYVSNSYKPGFKTLRYRDSGKPNYSKSIYDVIASLREQGLNLPKKPKVQQSHGSGGPIRLEDGTSIGWYKSSPPSKCLDIEVPDELEKKYHDMLIAAIAMVPNAATASQEALWNSLRSDVREVLTTPWEHPMEARDIASGNKELFYINWDNAGGYDRKKLPAGWKEVEDNGRTSWTVYTKQGKIHIAPHTYNSTLKVEVS